MYDYTHDIYPATEGAFSSFIEGVKKIINGVAEWLRTKITKIGNALRIRSRRKPKNASSKSTDKTHSDIDTTTSKNTDTRSDTATTKKVNSRDNIVAINDKNARDIISAIDSETSALIIACSTVLRNLVAKCEKVAHNPTTFKPSEIKIDRFEPSRVELNDKPNFNVKSNTFDFPEIGTTFNDVFDEYASIMRSYDKHADKIKNALAQLKSMQSLSDDDIKRGYEALKSLYSANGRFGSSWSDVATVYEFVDSESKIKKILGKIVEMYNFGIKTTKYLGTKIMAEVDKEVTSAEVNSEDLATLKKWRSMNESAIISRLYDAAYESAMNDIKMRSEYIKMYESVPDAFEYI